MKESSFLDGQLGVVAKSNFKRGDVLFTVNGPILGKPTKYSFSIGLDKHIDPIKNDGKFDFGHYLNHSCDPNTFVRIIEKDDLPYIEIVARKDIESGEELAFDYASLEYDTIVSGNCKCSTRKCRGVIHGFKDLHEDIVRQYKKEGMIPAHLLHNNINQDRPNSKDAKAPMAKNIPTH